MKVSEGSIVEFRVVEPPTKRGVLSGDVLRVSDDGIYVRAGKSLWLVPLTHIVGCKEPKPT